MVPDPEVKQRETLEIQDTSQFQMDTKKDELQMELYQQIQQHQLILDPQQKRGLRKFGFCVCQNQISLAN